MQSKHTRLQRPSHAVVQLHFGRITLRDFRFGKPDDLARQGQQLEQYKKDLEGSFEAEKRRLHKELEEQQKDTPKVIARTGLISGPNGCKTEEHCWGTNAPWMDDSGSIDGKKIGVAIFDVTSYAIAKLALSKHLPAPKR